MGLDMYLTAEKYVSNWSHKEPEERENAQAIGRLVGIDPLPGNYIKVEIQCAYWRKANAIHRWFVATVQNGKDDCGYYYASREKLKQLVALCKAAKENPTGAKENLPTQSGFFFGDTSYGAAYLEDLDSTIAQIGKLLADTRWEDFEFQYHSSW